MIIKDKRNTLIASDYLCLKIVFNDTQKNSFPIYFSTIDFLESFLYFVANGRNNSTKSP